mmetsp:Transcript_38466/g.81573  ORF Transcript_38466/g.81573 Transcript_38466/m.81573 type:complete len:96 (-) Transcript_38466:42-329(-)
MGNKGFAAGLGGTDWEYGISRAAGPPLTSLPRRDRLEVSGAPTGGQAGITGAAGAAGGAAAAVAVATGMAGDWGWEWDFDLERIGCCCGGASSGA